MTLHTIPLQPPATLSAATAAINRARAGDRVLLVLPDPPDGLAHAVRLQVLRRQADAAGVQVGLVTADPDVRYHARQARIPIFASAAEGEHRWRYAPAQAPLPDPQGVRPFLVRPPARVGLGLHAPEIVTQPGGAILAGRMRRRSGRGWLAALGYLLLLLILAGLLAGVTLFLLPRAHVTLIPARTRFVSSIDLTARVGIDAPDYLNRVVPARSVQARVELFDTVETTGGEDAPLGRATGVVTLINQTNRPIDVGTSTVVRTATGDDVRFRLQQEVTIPAGVGQQVSAQVEAIEPGLKGNVPAFTISEIEGPLNLTVRVSNPSPTAGGTVEPVRVVTQADKDRLLGQLQATLQQQAYSKLAESLRQGEFIPAETVRTFTLAETYDRFSGERADVLGLQLQLLARGLAVDLEGAGSLVSRSLRENIPGDHFLLEETLRVGQPTFTRFGDESVDMSLTASGDTLIPITTSRVRSLLAGAPLEDAAGILQRNLQLASPPQVSLEPNWLGRIPYIPTRITVRVLQGSAGS